MPKPIKIISYICARRVEEFYTNMLGMPPDRDIDFCIDLKSGTRSISIYPYRMALAELREVKAQLQELLDNGLFILVHRLGDMNVIAFDSRQMKVYEINYPNHDLKSSLFTTVYLNPRQRRRIELLKDYDVSHVTIQYHLGKANVVADSLSWKTVRMGSMASLGVSKRPLAGEIYTLESKFMHLGFQKR
ncbi:hypothetical protein MTR67_030478, partial [Solanum verrucosum]